ncbi:MAG: hypothetical protein EOO48_00900 [Flavobacterium sp.]|nr:MAG: hypothetical protein EOO48_00900 [Flavobacterium sp.]
MKNHFFTTYNPVKIILVLLLFPAVVSAQEAPQANVKSKSDFWNHVSFGGGIGASFGSAYTDVSLSPAALYEFNDHFGLGLGLQGSYVKVKGDYYDDQLNNYSSWIYGGSVIGVFNPIEEIQLSLEPELVRVNTTFNYDTALDFKDNFWNTALFVGAGYRAQNVTIGVRYNVLFDKDKSVYYEPFMPFVRVFF